MQELEIHRILIVSTAHVTEADMRWLTAECSWTSEYGVIIPVDDDEPDIDTFGVLASPAFAKLWHIAQTRGCVFLCLDRDGPVLDGLDTFKW
jgi:hypothetical protein